MNGSTQRRMTDEQKAFEVAFWSGFHGEDVREIEKHLLVPLEQEVQSSEAERSAEQSAVRDTLTQLQKCVEEQANLCAKWEGLQMPRVGTDPGGAISLVDAAQLFTELIAAIVFLIVGLVTLAGDVAPALVRWTMMPLLCLTAAGAVTVASTVVGSLANPWLSMLQQGNRTGLVAFLMLVAAGCVAAVIPSPFGGYLAGSLGLLVSAGLLASLWLKRRNADAAREAQFRQQLDTLRATEERLRQEAAQIESRLRQQRPLGVQRTADLRDESRRLAKAIQIGFRLGTSLRLSRNGHKGDGS